MSDSRLISHKAKYTTITSDVSGKEHDVKEVIQQNGGRVYKKFTAKCNALVVEELDTSNKTIKRAAGLEIPVVDCEKLIQGQFYYHS